MKPIISPWLIYLIDLFDDLRELFGIALILLGCAAVVLSIIWLYKIGCVRGGADWEVVYKIIEEELKDYDVE